MKPSDNTFCNSLMKTFGKSMYELLSAVLLGLSPLLLDY